jgi:uncharacterized protein (DUF2267 family)
MSATGLDVFDKTLQITNTWLGEIMDAIGPSRQTAWHALGAVLRTIRDRVPLGVAAHLGAELPLLVRGLYYDQWRPSEQPEIYRTLDEFLARVEVAMDPIETVSAQEAAAAVFAVLARHVAEGQVRKVREVLPSEVRAIWPIDAGEALEVVEVELEVLPGEAQRAGT